MTNYDALDKGELFQNLQDAIIKESDLFSQVEREGLLDEYMRWVIAGLDVRRSFLHDKL